MAGANAITILNVARFPFSGMNLSGIWVKGADLSQGILDHTDLSGADLRGVNFDQAFLGNAVWWAAASRRLLRFHPANGNRRESSVRVAHCCLLPETDAGVNVYDLAEQKSLPPIMAPEGEEIRILR